MQADVKAAQSAKNYTKPTMKGPTVINEQILRVMQSLGIDPVRTAESVKNDNYDHHAAIYFLLQDKLQSTSMTQNQNMPKTNKTASDSPAKINQKQMSAEINPPEIIPEHQRRRPSTIAEQAS